MSTNLHRASARALRLGIGLTLVSASAIGCGDASGTATVATDHQAVVAGGTPLVAPSIRQFVLLASSPIALGDRSQLAGGDVGTTAPAGGALGLSVGFDAQVGGDLFAAATRLFDRASVGNVSTDQLTAPFAHEKAVSPFSAPPSLPVAGPLSPGAVPVSVASGATRTLAPGGYAAVTVEGKLILSGGSYDVASLTLGPDAQLIAAAASVLRIAGSLSAGDRVTLAADSGLAADALRIIVGATGASAARFGNDGHLTALLLVPAGTAFAGDRLAFTGAAAAQGITVGNDGIVHFDSGFACSVDAECDDGNACTQDACVAGFCTNPPVADGTACNDGDACTQSDSCQSGVCTGADPVVCTASDLCHVAGVCDPGNGQCSNPAAPDGTRCNAGTCEAGVCQCDAGHSGPNCDIVDNQLTFKDSGGTVLASTTIPTNNAFAYALVDGDLPPALGDDRTVIFTAGSEPPGQEVVVYSFPYGFGPDDQGGVNSGVSDVIVGHWPCLPTQFVSLPGIPGQPVQADHVLAVHAVRYVHGTCRAGVPFRSSSNPPVTGLFDQASQQILSAIQTNLAANVNPALVSFDFDFDVFQPHYQSQGANNHMGIFFEASYFFNLLHIQGLGLHALMDPAFNLGVRPSDGLLQVGSIAQNVLVTNDTFGVKELIQSALKGDGDPRFSVPAQVENAVNGQLTIQVGALASSLGVPLGSLQTTCATPTVNAPSQECFDQIQPALALGASFSPLLQAAAQAVQPANFGCDGTNQCTFHPILQAVNVLPDQLEFVLSPDLSHPGPDTLTPFYSAIPAGALPAGVNISCAPIPTDVKRGFIAAAFHGNPDSGGGIQCGSNF